MTLKANVQRNTYGAESRPATWRPVIRLQIRYGRQAQPCESPRLLGPRTKLTVAGCTRQLAIFASAALVMLAALHARCLAAEMPWATSYGEAVKSARAGRRVVMVDMFTSWCTWCAAMDRSTYKDPTVVSVIQSGFVPVRVNAEAEGITLAKAHGVNVFPTVLFFDGEGRLIGTIVGYRSPSQMVEILRKIRSEPNVQRRSAEPEFAARAGAITKRARSQVDRGLPFDAYASLDGAFKEGRFRNSEQLLALAVTVAHSLLVRQKAAGAVTDAVRLLTIACSSRSRPTQLSAHVELGAAYVKLGRYSKALAAFKSAAAFTQSDSLVGQHIHEAVDQLSNMRAK